MRKCPYCGSDLADDARFCVECGKPLPEDAPAAAPAAPTEPVTAPTIAVPAEPTAPVPEESDAPVITQVPSKKQMLSTFQYVALSLLFSLPVIGLIFLFIFGAGHPKNVSLKRFSAALLILRLVLWIAIFALLIVAMVKNGSLLTKALGELIPAVEALFRALFA